MNIAITNGYNYLKEKNILIILTQNVDGSSNFLYLRCSDVDAYAVQNGICSRAFCTEANVILLSQCRKAADDAFCSWPLISQDSTPCDFVFLWDYVKDMYAQNN